MTRKSNPVSTTVASLLLAVGISLPVVAQETAPNAASTGEAAVAVPEDRLDRLFDRLSEAEPGADGRILTEIFTEWSKSGSPTVDLLLSRAQDALDAGDLQAAIDHATAAIDYAPDFAEPYHMRATAYYLTGRIGPSLADLRRTLALEPRHFRALRGLAVILEEMGEPDRAMDVLDVVLELHPADADAAAARERLQRMFEGRSL